MKHKRVTFTRFVKNHFPTNTCLFRSILLYPVVEFARARYMYRSVCEEAPYTPGMLIICLTGVTVL